MSRSDKEYWTACMCNWITKHQDWYWYNTRDRQIYTYIGKGEREKEREGAREKKGRTAIYIHTYTHKHIEYIPSAQTKTKVLLCNLLWQGDNKQEGIKNRESYAWHISQLKKKENEQQFCRGRFAPKYEARMQNVSAPNDKWLCKFNLGCAKIVVQEH